MLQISIPYVYELGTQLQQLRNVNYGSVLKNVMWILLGSEKSLNEFLTGSVYTYNLKASHAPGQALIQAIKRLSIEPDKERELDFYDSYSITNALDKFEAVLTAEMNVGAAYLVTKKRGYDTGDLIARAEVLFPSELPQKVPECLAEIREAGKCIAFEMGTAAGFHIMRATELVLRRYYDVATIGAPRPANNNIGGYLKEMEDGGKGAPKVIAALRQITSLHRNPLMHPEENLTLDDAIALLGIAQSAIVAMLREIPDAPAAPLVLSATK
ncbi:MAG TPA: hypothetical protein VGQ12_05040 [Candidatus Angelobacter sp.]|jgi:hypothetical protein|nr:hypothetical protein [Candidatus Angelobacter sp.]